MESLYLFKPIFETKGTGTVQFKNGSQTPASFHLSLLTNGITLGEIAFPPSFLSEFNKLMTLNKVNEFSLNGMADLNDQKLSISMLNCFLTAFSMSSGQVGLNLKSEFFIGLVILSEESMTSQPSNELIIQFTLTNIFQTFRVSVETDLGRLELRHFKDVIDLDEVMRNYRMQLITSLAILNVSTDGTTTLDTIIDKATKIVESFLKITTLSQGAWHDWVSVSVYSASSNKLISMKISSPKNKIPYKLGITNKVHSGEFIRSAWKGYSDELNTQYGFNLALEWYTEANIASVIESKFLSATTCLELLMDKYHTKESIEYLLPDPIFKEFMNRIKDDARSWLKENNVDKSTRAALYSALDGINRKQYVDKAKKLLDFWHVKYDDLNITFEEIVEIRNQITHRGVIGPSKENGEKLIHAHYALMMILTRIFLAMLKYDNQYYDLVKSNWIKFSDVRSLPPV